jgi:hypothetical protein
MAVARAAATAYSSASGSIHGLGSVVMLSFILWLVLLVLCWPLALLALLLYPLVWLLLLPFRLVGIGVEAVFALLRAMVMLPARMLRGSPGR